MHLMIVAINLSIAQHFTIVFVIFEYWMSSKNRTSMCRYFQEGQGKEQQNVQEQIPTSPNHKTSNELNPMKQILKQYIRQSQKMSTFKNVSFNKMAQNQQNSSRKQMSTLQNNEVQYSLLAINQITAVAITRMGIRNYDNMENQDVIYEEQLSNKCKIYGVFDGHGRYGRDMSLTAKNIFQSLLSKYSQEFKSQSALFSIESIIKKVLQKTNAYLLHYKAQQAQFSGTTALITVLTSTAIYFFNIGNSRAVLGKYYENQNKIEAFQVTHDHTLSRFDERLRVLNSQSVIRPYRNQRGELIGPQRLWAQNENYPGITITRTMGLSCASKLGVTSEPQISILKYQSNFRFIVLASDGLWTVMQNKEVLEMLQKAPVNPMNTLVAYANSLMFQALKRWRERDEMMDDVSIIVIPLVKQ